MLSSSSTNVGIIHYNIPTFLVTDSDTNAFRKLIGTRCNFFGLKHLTTTPYHPQTNGQAERLNRILIARLRHYVAEHQHDWDIFMQPLAYTYNTLISRSTGLTSFSLVLSGQLPSPIIFKHPSALPMDARNVTAPHTLKACLLYRLAVML